MNRLLIIINKQLNNNPNSPTIPFFPPKVTLLPSLLGRGRGRGFHPFFPTKSHHSPPYGGGAGGRALRGAGGWAFFPS